MKITFRPSDSMNFILWWYWNALVRKFSLTIIQGIQNQLCMKLNDLFIHLVHWLISSFEERWPSEENFVWNFKVLALKIEKLFWHNFCWNSENNWTVWIYQMRKFELARFQVFYTLFSFCNHFKCIYLHSTY